MLVQHIIARKQRSNFSVISERCSQFIQESCGQPLLKNLSVEYTDIHKVKARKRNLVNEFTTAFNIAFESYTDDLCQRAIFANGASSFQPIFENNLEPFYVFPIDGYSFLYSSEVDSSTEHYKQVFDVMFEEFGFNKGKDVILDVLKFSYKQTDLYEGIQKGSEIILFNIPFYYGVRASTYDYNTLLTLIADIK